MQAWSTKLKTLNIVNFNLKQALYKMLYLPSMSQNAKDISTIERNGVW
jgi:hypothetical protein